MAHKKYRNGNHGDVMMQCNVYKNIGKQSDENWNSEIQKFITKNDSRYNTLYLFLVHCRLECQSINVLEKNIFLSRTKEI